MIHKEQQKKLFGKVLSSKELKHIQNEWSEGELLLLYFISSKKTFDRYGGRNDYKGLMKEIVSKSIYGTK